MLGCGRRGKSEDIAVSTAPCFQANVAVTMNWDTAERGFQVINKGRLQGSGL